MNDSTAAADRMNPTSESSLSPTTPNTNLSPAPVKDAQLLELFAYLDQGLSVSASAAKAGIHERAAYRALAKYESRIDAIVPKLLSLHGIDFVRDWTHASRSAAKKGDHRPAMQALQSIKAVEPIGDSGTHGGIVINIGTPEHPIRHPLVTVSPGESDEG